MTDVNESALTQEARRQLRESFLRDVSELKGQPCHILTYEQSTLEATFKGWKPDGSEVLVSNLKTPANIIMSSALLRTPDILAIHFDTNINPE
ncbi:uncharacterized protein LOC116773044 [Danaus plexippus]|uniref:Gem n=1 Tax=Danaus plexippus plexippus TaxID=278856 RepID=A0A212ER89_DANPL|nr:uncharacterized protein LOC116773044 [Danaus plexippus]OWR44012.1 gem [Danaus plexippus plexippus]